MTIELRLTKTRKGTYLVEIFVSNTSIGAIRILGDVVRPVFYVPKGIYRSQELFSSLTPAIAETLNRNPQVFEELESEAIDTLKD